jgi:isocitrate dehydrogenase kinase/phosphatase
MQPMSAASLEVKEAVAMIKDSFQRFYGTFDELTIHAKERFQQRQWKEQREAVRKRILLHDETIEETARRLSNFQLLGKGWWKNVAIEYDIATNHNPLAQTFLDAVGRICFKGDIAFTLFDSSKVKISVLENYLEKIIVHRPFHGWVADLLQKIDIEITEQSIQKPSAKIASLLSEIVIQSEEATLFFYPDLFYRNKHAYLLGYAMDGEKLIPLLFAFTNTENGIILDALLYTEEDIKNVFAFSRSYFLVATTDAKALVDFLLKVMPSKPEPQLYMNLGYQEHGKELVIRLLQQHLQNHRSQFVVAPGIAGMVMMVFTLPDYDLVFKLIRDHFRPPKSVTREEVIEKYKFIALHDRVGRLADAQRFEYLGLPLAYFDSQLLNYLLTECSQSVSVRNGIVCFQDVYTERKMIPLNLYFEQTTPAKAERAVMDFGNAIREMALSNIFPGDLLIKNFGVTNEDRVVFYDYDEIVPLADCTFKDIPKARNDDEEMSAEPWFAVNENDIFPQELVKFLLPEGTLRDKFATNHQELYTATFWNSLKQFHQRGELVDIQPYQSNLM